MIIALIIIGVILLAFIVPHSLVLAKIFRRFFKRYDAKNIEKVFYNNKTYEGYWDQYKEATEWLMNLGSRTIEIQSFDGLKLSAQYFDIGSDKLIIFVHGVHATIYTNFAIHAKEAINRGYNVLMIDQRSHGNSKGKYVTYGKYEHQDVLSWVDYVDKYLEVDKIYLYGISMGATSVCLASEKIDNPKVKALVADSAYTTLEDLMKFIMKTYHAPSFMFLRSMRFLAKHKAKVDFNDFDTRKSLANNKIPTMFVYGTTDIVVSKDFLIDNYNTCASLKEELVIENANHTLAMVVGGEEAFAKLFKFLQENT